MAEIFYANHLGFFSQEEAEQIKLSHEAFLAEEQLYGDECERANLEMTGEIVPDSESVHT